jgi:glutathione S-transferase
MSKPLLYLALGACSRVTMNAFEEAGIDFDGIAIDTLGGQQKGPEYQKINPRGKVPALIIDGKLLTENAAMILYIHALKPEAKLLPRANSPFEQAKIHSDLIWCSGGLHPAIRMVRMPMRFTDGDFSGVFEKGSELLHAMFVEVAERVSGDKWWYGDDWSIMDVYLCWAYGLTEATDFPLKDYPEIIAHGERVRERPSYKRALARELAAAEEANIDLSIAPK